HVHSTLVVAAELVETTPQVDARRKHEWIQLDQIPAVAALPDARLGNEVGRSGQRGAGYPANALVEGHVHAVEQTSDRRVGAIVVRCTFPQASTIHMDGDGVLARPGRLRLQIGPRR